MQVHDGGWEYRGKRNYLLWQLVLLFTRLQKLLDLQGRPAARPLLHQNIVIADQNDSQDIAFQTIAFVYDWRCYALLVLQIIVATCDAVQL